MPSHPRDEFRILAGYNRNKYLDCRAKTWESDSFFTGGEVIEGLGLDISRTLDPTLYRTGRTGDFRCDIPLEPGVYELHLHFAETVLGDIQFEGAGGGTRRFDVLLNGTPILRDFDIILDAGGPNIADEKVFIDVSPAIDGVLHLAFKGHAGGALLNAIEVFPGTPGRIRPIRVLPGTRLRIDREGAIWGPDQFFMGGMVIERPEYVKSRIEPLLYARERVGNFDYAIPVVEGTYTVTLKFCERHFGPTGLGGGGAGSRIFDVYCNGEALLRNFDIIAEAGEMNQSVDKTFRGLKPNGQDKLALSFVPRRYYACVDAIEVIQET